MSDVWLSCRAVSGLLSYPSHQVHRYRRVAGTCEQTGWPVPAVSVGAALDVSWTTCRYLCDQERQRPCLGFTYRPSPPTVNHLGVNSTRSGPPPRCLLISTVCQLVKTERRDRAATYLKGPLITGS